MRVAFSTFGCKLNQYETESLASTFHGPEYQIVSPTQRADLFIINTCTVTSKSVQKARRTVRRIARSNPAALIVATGCYAQIDRDALQSLGENVVAVSQSEKGGLHDLAASLVKRPIRDVRQEKDRLGERLDGIARRDPFGYDVVDFSFHSRGFLKIQDGCDNRCSYCMIPLARGSSVSLEPKLVAQRARRMKEAGYGEIVLTGVNIASYQFEGIDFPLLVESLLAGTGGVQFRLSSIEPDRIDAAFLAMIGHPRICPHFHIPVQSGSNSVLERMNRRYRRKTVIEAVEGLRSSKGEPFLAADIIAGFPTEGPEDFQQTVELIRELSFSALHVFPYSPREGTPAAEMASRVSDREKRRRVRSLLALSEELVETYRASWMGRDVRAVVEGKIASDGTARGLSENYLKLLIHGIPAGKVESGMLVRCRIDESPAPLTARFVDTISGR
jgi:threonylcarbamoyladenosine tRNA methylthiotransferase MtaB